MLDVGTVPNWTDVAQVALVALQLAVIAVAAVYAKRQVDEAKRQVAEAKTLREEQARPFVVVDFDVQDTLIFLVISNLGASLARDVRFDIAPTLSSTISDHPPAALKVFSKGISTLAPGKTIRTLFDSFPQRESEGLDDFYSVRIRYADEKRRRAFDETLDLDIGIYRNLLVVTRHDIHHVKDSLDRIRKVMEKWGAGTGRRGLIAMSPDQRRAEIDRETRTREERRRPNQATSPPET